MNKPLCYNHTNRLFISVTAILLLSIIIIILSMVLGFSIISDKMTELVRIPVDDLTDLIALIIAASVTAYIFCFQLLGEVKKGEEYDDIFYLEIVISSLLFLLVGIFSGIYSMMMNPEKPVIPVMSILSCLISLILSLLHGTISGLLACMMSRRILRSGVFEKKVVDNHRILDVFKYNPNWIQTIDCYLGDIQGQATFINSEMSMEIIIEKMFNSTRCKNAECIKQYYAVSNLFKNVQSIMYNSEIVGSWFIFKLLENCDFDCLEPIKNTVSALIDYNPGDYKLICLQIDILSW